MRSHIALWAVYRWDRTHEPKVDVGRDQRDQEGDRIGLGAVDREIRATSATATSSDDQP
jgi:hypothetical protein